MTHVVLESCIRCKYTDCVDVCPVDCFREGPNFLTIDPDECIDCAVYIPECPVNAILPEQDVPTDELHFIKLNAELSRKWPSITKRQAPQSDADDWKDRKDKLSESIRRIDGPLRPAAVCLRDPSLAREALIAQRWMSAFGFLGRTARRRADRAARLRGRRRGSGHGCPPDGGCFGARVLRSCSTPDSPRPSRASQRQPDHQGASR